MTIRRALVWLVLIALLPLALASTLSLASLYRTQHAAAGERVLERVRALRIALDVEISATQRMLSAVAERQQLRTASVAATPDLIDGLRRLSASNEMWFATMVVEPDGTETVRVDAERSRGSPRAPSLDESTRRRVLLTRAPQLSPLVGNAGGPLFTFVAAPVVSEGRVLRLVAVAVPSEAWLAFLGRYPVDPQATLTLNDSDGRVVARTRDHDLWAGRTSRADYWQHTRQADEGHFRNQSLEGTDFLSAFSHLSHGGWVLGTGVPATVITRPLWTQAALVGALLLVSVMTAGVLAAWLGRRIARALQDLAALATDPAAGEATGSGGLPIAGSLPLAEAERVRQALSAAFRKESDSRRAAEESRREREQFVATLAHELRNPLGAIHSALAVVERVDAQDESKRQAAAILKRQVTHLTRLMADLFEASRPQDSVLRLATEVVDLADVCRDTIDAFRAEGRLARVELGTDLQPVPAHVDPARMQQVVANLLGNAVKFSPDPARVRLALCREGPDAVLTVRDEGAGIAPDLLGRVFEPFVQGDSRKSHGLGLGLNVVRRIVELHGGTAQVISAGPGSGTTVVVRLPALSGLPS